MFVKPAKIQCRRLLTVRDLAAKLSKSVSGTWANVAAGELPKGFKVGGSTRWDEAEIDAWIGQKLAERDHDADRRERLGGTA